METIIVSDKCIFEEKEDISNNLKLCYSRRIVYKYILIMYSKCIGANNEIFSQQTIPEKKKMSNL